MILNTLDMGAGPPVVLLHGLFGAAKNLNYLIRGLSPQARVLAMDLRNHGDSPHGLPMDIATLAADVAETLDHLGVGSARVAGHSLGGKAAMMLALTRPERVERLAVLDIAPIRYNHEYDEYVKAMQAIKLTPGLTRHDADAALAAAVPAPQMRAFLLNNLVRGETMRWRIGLEEIGTAMPGLLAWDDQNAAPFTKPALFLAAGDSHYVPPSADAAINRLFPGAERKTVAGASHWLHADKPQEVLEDLKEFFFP
jgi:pimeloyl-ACP methyl ester carboxylesterase